MAQNVGKKFENNFKSSVPEDVMYHRLHDAPQSWSQDRGTRFSWQNPCDALLFQDGLLLALELKTTKDKSYSVEMEKNTNKTAKIHYHQVEGLREFAKYKGIVPGFVLNYRIKEGTPEYTELTYFIHINDFDRMMGEINKKSFTILDLLKYSPIKIESTKKRTNFKYDIGSFLIELNKKYK